MKRAKSAVVSNVKALAQLKSLLYGCTDERLASFDVDFLCRTHRVDRRTAEYELTIARQKRVRLP